MKDHVLYKVCVVGGGLLGSALTHCLSRKYGEKILNISLPHGSMGEYFSSFDDDSRMYRRHPENEYWDNLALMNEKLMLNLQRSTGIDFVAPIDVYHSFQSDGQVRYSSVKEVSPGYLIHPKKYVLAMKNDSIKNASNLVEGCVSGVSEYKEGWKVTTDDGGAYYAEKVVELTGFHSLLDLKSVGGFSCGKIVMFTHGHHRMGHENKFCFIDSDISEFPFSDAYGFVNYRKDKSYYMSKYGFSENTPIILDTQTKIKDWFNGKYLTYPYLEQAISYVQKKHVSVLDKKSVILKPCSFTKTKSGKPEKVVKGNGWVSFVGCNGVSAKLCQSLAVTFMDEII